MKNASNIIWNFSVVRALKISDASTGLHRQYEWILVVREHEKVGFNFWLKSNHNIVDRVESRSASTKKILFLSKHRSDNTKEYDP